MIQSFADKATEALYHGKPVRQFASFRRIAERKLVQLNNARSLQDLGAIPGNHLEKLLGKRREEYAVRVNDQFRIVFRWRDDGPYDVKIEDYH
jgi:proteic killer suppression protein